MPSIAARPTVSVEVTGLAPKRWANFRPLIRVYGNILGRLAALGQPYTFCADYMYESSAHHPNFMFQNYTGCGEGTFERLRLGRERVQCGGERQALAFLQWRCICISMMTPQTIYTG
jgi:hypothetical protein